MSGMRTMSAPAAIGILPPFLAVAEMIFDKLPFIPDRTDPLPLAGRACMGALAGAVIARDGGRSAVAGGLVGALTAVAMAHLMYQARSRAPGVLGGFVEDAIVVAMGVELARSRGSSSVARRSRVKI